MNIAYLILAHNNPNHLCRLISALSENWAHFYIHIDRKSHLGEFEQVCNRPRTQLARRRLPICWGGFSMVQATLDLLSQAAMSGLDPDWYVLLSGADYPIRANTEILAFLSNSKKEHICCYPMPGPNNRKSLERLETFRFEGALGQSRLRRMILHQTNRLLAYHKRNYRAVLGQMTPYAGSQWWALSQSAVTHILDFVRTEKRFALFFRHSLIPDEMFFQTILGNSPFRAKIARNLTYADWTQGISRHPALLTDAHIDKFADPAFYLDDEEGTGPCFFARKFTDRDIALLDRLDVVRAAGTAAEAIEQWNKKS